MKSRPRRKKRASPMTNSEALKAMDEMLAPIAGQLMVAVELEASMEVLNEEVRSRDRPAIYGGETLKVIQQAYVSELALCLAKLYETPVPREGSTVTRAFNSTNIASIPLLLRLVQQERCLAVLCRRNSDWSADGVEVRRLVKEAASIWGKMRGSATTRRALDRVRDYRHYLVHLLRRGPPAQLPTYRELFILVDNAAAIVRLLHPALTGTNRNLSDFEEVWKDEAKDFWSRALEAVIIPIGQPIPPSRGLSEPAAP